MMIDAWLPRSMTGDITAQNHTMQWAHIWKQGILIFKKMLQILQRVIGYFSYCHLLNWEIMMQGAHIWNEVIRIFNLRSNAILETWHRQFWSLSCTELRIIWEITDSQLSYDRNISISGTLRLLVVWPILQTSNSVWISNYIHYTVWDEINY